MLPESLAISRRRCDGFAREQVSPQKIGSKPPAQLKVNCREWLLFAADCGQIDLAEPLHPPVS
jgi:hypothetical protein